MGYKAGKGEHHAGKGATARDDQAPRETRQQTDPKPKKKKRKPGPGRPKGSTLQESGLTPNQERIAQEMLAAELDTGLFPSSVAQVAKVTGTDPNYVRDLLKRKTFQDYLFDLLKLEGLILEGAFWHGIALGLSAGDPKVLELYAKMTGKITKKTETELKVIIEGIPGSAGSLDWSDNEGDIVDAVVVED